MLPRPLNDCERFNRLVAVSLAPSSVTYGLAAVSRNTSPHPMTKRQKRKAEKLPINAPGIKKTAPRPKSRRPNTTPRR